MGLLCDLFGHKLPKRGWWGDGLYGKVSGGHRDGTGRSHYQVRNECSRCGESFITARFHGEQVRHPTERHGK
jgi:hypothetical protein